MQVGALNHSNDFGSAFYCKNITEGIIKYAKVLYNVI